MYPRTPNLPITDPDLVGYRPQRLAFDQLRPEHQAELLRLGFASEDGRLSSATLDIVGADALQALQLARVLARTEIPLSQDWCNDEPGGCNGNLGLYRNEMPQIADKTAAKLAASVKADERDAAHAILLTGGPRDKTVLSAFLDHLRGMGIGVAPASAAVGGLRATQREIQTAKAYGMADAYLRGKFPSLAADTVVVSSDWHLLDGHHRWAALMTIDPRRIMQVIQINLPIREILRLAAAFPGVYAADLKGRVQPDPFQLEYKRKAKAELAAHGRTASHTDSKVSAMTRRSNPSESVRIMRSANPAKTSDTLKTVRSYFPSASVERSDSDGLRRTAYVGRLGPSRGAEGTERTRIVWIEPGGLSCRIRVYRYADPRRDATLSAHVLVEERVFDLANLAGELAAVIAKYGDGARTGNPAASGLSAEQRARVERAERKLREHHPHPARPPERFSAGYSSEARAGGWDALDWNARTGNPPALIWEFDGEPTSPKALLADNPDNGDVAAAVAYLKAEGAKFAMGRHGTKGVRSWSAVSFGGGAADEQVLTVRAAWTDGPVFKAVLDASTIPYAGDLPDADAFSWRAGSDNWQDDFYSDFEESGDD